MHYGVCLLRQVILEYNQSINPANWTALLPVALCVFSLVRKQRSIKQHNPWGRKAYPLHVLYFARFLPLLFHDCMFHEEENIHLFPRHIQSIYFNLFDQCVAFLSKGPPLLVYH